MSQGYNRGYSFYNRDRRRGRGGGGGRRGGRGGGGNRRYGDDGNRRYGNNNNNNNYSNEGGYERYQRPSERNNNDSPRRGGRRGRGNYRRDNERRDERDNQGSRGGRRRYGNNSGGGGDRRRNNNNNERRRNEREDNRRRNENSDPISQEAEKREKREEKREEPQKKRKKKKFGKRKTSTDEQRKRRFQNKGGRGRGRRGRGRGRNTYHDPRDGPKAMRIETSKTTTKGNEENRNPSPTESTVSSVSSHFDVRFSDQKEILERGLRKERYECYVCYEVILRNDPVWNCKQCHHIFHLRCIKKWASQSSKTGKFNCPICATTYNEAPNQYFCFCGKTKNPDESLYGTPHSCEMLCGKKRDECPHTCPEQCHPGPCPECSSTRMETCFCSKINYRVPCAEKNSKKSCGGECEKILNCEKHKCKKNCHSGECEKCTVENEETCYCGKVTQKRVCEKNEVKIDPITKEERTFSCKLVCGKELECGGGHECSQTCHIGPCPPCQSLPEFVKTCQCGKTTLEKLKVERKSCLDPIPCCKKRCKKLLACGRHFCSKFCHDGKCLEVCRKKVHVTCRCGQKTTHLPCFVFNYPSMVSVDGNDYNDEKIKEEFKKHVEEGKAVLPFTCKKICRRSLKCGRHKCKNVCCPASNPRFKQRVQEGNPNFLASSTRQQQIFFHICEKLCKKKLDCGKHHCDWACHFGPCPPCKIMIQRPISCRCGKTTLLPPQKCGVNPPVCHQPCRKRRKCGHNDLNDHDCHFGSCPPCRVKVSRPCTGGHGIIVRNVACHLTVLSCGGSCSKPLPCREHRCPKKCSHRGNCCKNPGIEMTDVEFKHITVGLVNNTIGKEELFVKEKKKNNGTEEEAEGEINDEEKKEKEKKQQTKINPITIKFGETFLSSCGRKCGKEMSSCGHPCSQPCHPNALPCPALKCQEWVKCMCRCKRKQKRMRCSNLQPHFARVYPNRMPYHYSYIPILLQCDDGCEKLKRKRELARIFQIDVSKHEMPEYQEMLQQYYQKDPDFIIFIEEKFSSFIRNENQQKLHFTAMKKEKRTVIHYLSDNYGLESQSIDFEPFKHVCLSKVMGRTSCPKKKYWLSNVMKDETLLEKLRKKLWESNVKQEKYEKQQSQSSQNTYSFKMTERRKKKQKKARKEGTKMKTEMKDSEMKDLSGVEDGMEIARNLRLKSEGKKFKNQNPFSNLSVDEEDIFSMKNVKLKKKKKSKKQELMEKLKKEEEERKKREEEEEIVLESFLEEFADENSEEENSEEEEEDNEKEKKQDESI